MINHPPPHIGIQGLTLECSELSPGALYALVFEKNIGVHNHLTPDFFSTCVSVCPVLYVAINPQDSLPTKNIQWPFEDCFQVLKLNHKKTESPCNNADLLPALEFKLNSISKVRKSHINSNQIIFFELFVDETLTNEELHRYLSKELHYFSSWIRVKQYTMVLIVKNTSSNHSVQGGFLAHNELLSGIASVHTNGQQQLLWQTLFWHSCVAVTSEVEFILTEDKVSAQWVAVPNPRIKGAVTPREPSRNLNLVVLTEVITDANQAPGSWIIVSSIDEAIHQSKVSTPQAVILAYQNPETFKSLLERILLLRKNLKPTTRILVRELGTQLRHQEQRIAVQLGTYGILPKELNFSRCLQMIETITAGQLKYPSQAVISNAFKGIDENTQQGYLRKTPFVKKINLALKSGLQYNVEHALIKFRIIPGMLPEHCIIACKTQRNGDYYTASKHFVYLFLEGCRTNDIGKSIASLFDLPVADLFSNEYRFCHPSDIFNELKAILKKQAYEDWPDLSTVCSQFEAPPVSPQPSTQPSTPISTKTFDRNTRDGSAALSALPMKKPNREKTNTPAPDLPFTDSDLALVKSITEEEMIVLNDIKQVIADTQNINEDIKPSPKTANKDKLRKTTQWPSPPSS